MEAIKEVVADERFPGARNQIANRHLDNLLAVIADLQGVADVLKGDDE